MQDKNYLKGKSHEWQSDSNTLLSQRNMVLHDDYGNDYEVGVFGKRIYGQKQFWKVYLMDFLAILGILESKQLEVLIYILENTRPSDNLFIGTYRAISENSGVSLDTTNKIMKKMQDFNFLKKIQNGVYMVNPALIMRGNERKKQIMIQYFQEDEVDCECSVMDSPALPEINEDAIKGQMSLENDFPDMMP